MPNLGTLGGQREETMNKKIKFLIVLSVLLLSLLAICSCNNEEHPNANYDELGYNIRIEFDANGGYFANSTQKKISDYYRLDDLMTNVNGNKELMIVDPKNEGYRNNIAQANTHPLATDSVRGYFFAGWYTEKKELLDEEGNVVKYENGDTVYVYENKWDFENDILELNPDKQYTANEPTLTLYAAWVKRPTVEIYAYHEYKKKDVLVGTYEIKSPENLKNATIQTPYLDLVKGEYDFATLKSAYDWQEREVKIKDKEEFTYFYEGLYFDTARTEKLGETYIHPYEYDPTNATIKNEVVKVYLNLDKKAGNWYRIYSATQFSANVVEGGANGNYEIMADLDFTNGKIEWPKVLKNNEFTGTIIGNGHTISNVLIESTNEQYFGMFQSISANAQIKDLAFDGVTAKISQYYYTSTGGRYAIVAAQIQNGFKFENVTFENCVLEISASAIGIVTADYEIGFVCADGYSSDLGVSLDGFTAKPITTVNDNFDLVIDINANDIELEYKGKSQK